MIAPLMQVSADWPAQHEHVLVQNDHLLLKGKAIQGALLRGELAAGYDLHFNSKPVHIDEQGRFILALGRDEPTTFTLAVFKSGSQVGSYVVPVELRDYPKQYINGVEQKYVAPDPEQIARSQRDNKRVRRARDLLQPQATVWQGFIWPVKGPITGVFGSQRVYNGEPRRPHYGVDVARPKGTPVVAPAAGLVTLADDLYFSGITLIIDHGHGLSSSFLHLNAVHVAQGSRVEQGQIVGEIGATGRVTGAHLDWRMNWTGVGGNARIDPQLLVPPMDWPGNDAGATPSAAATLNH